MAETPLEGIHRALVIGLGRSGVAATLALRDAGVEVVATETHPDAPGIGTARAAGADVRPATDPTPIVPAVDVVVPSPGVPEHAAPLVRAATQGVPVWSEPELGWRLAPRSVVGVTGTNGKTSVTELTADMLTRGGIDAETCGNIGRPFTEAARTTDAVLVAELSSFQLRFVHRLRPRVGALLNVAEDHADWHGDAAAYAAAKARLWIAQETDDWAVVNHDDAVARGLAATAPGRVAWFGRDLPTGAIGVRVDPEELVALLPDDRGWSLAVAELTTRAPHHIANVAAAALTALLAGAEGEGVSAAARAFRAGRHRIEVVAEGGGVTWVDDSKATNPHAAAAALSAFDRILWVAGGLAKGVDLATLAPHLGAVREAFLIGTSAPELAEVCASVGVPARAFGTLAEALEAAASAAGPGDTVLLAPACASFDMFDDYADRGDRFATLARDLASRASRSDARESIDG